MDYVEISPYYNNYCFILMIFAPLKTKKGVFTWSFVVSWKRETKPLFKGLYLWWDLVETWNMGYWQWRAFSQQKLFGFVKAARSYVHIYVEIMLLTVAFLSHISIKLKFCCIKMLYRFLIKLFLTNLRTLSGLTLPSQCCHVIVLKRFWVDILSWAYIILMKLN